MPELSIDPIVIRLIGGEKRKFLLTMGGIRRLKTRFEVKTIQELMSRDLSDVGVPLLYEAMLDKTGIDNEDALADRLPAHLEALAMSVGKLLGASFPPNENPPPASPTMPN